MNETDHRLAGMSLRQLRYFASVANCGSFRAASHALHISQPALTVQLHKLEELLGTPLFARTAKGAELTAAGESFLRFTTVALAELDRGLREISAITSTSHELRVGFAPTPGHALVADLMSAAADKRIKLSLIEGLSDQLWSSVLGGQLDAACCFQVGAGEGVNLTTLYRQELVVVGRSSTLCPGEEPLPLADLRRLPLVLSQREHFTRRWIEELTHHAGVDLELVLDVPIALRRDVILKNGHCALVPYGLFSDELRDGRLISRTLSPAIFRDVVLVVRKDLPGSLGGFLVSALRRLVAERMSEGQFGWRRADASPPPVTAG